MLWISTWIAFSFINEDTHTPCDCIISTCPYALCWNKINATTLVFLTSSIFIPFCKVPLSFTTAISLRFAHLCCSRFLSLCLWCCVAPGVVTDCSAFVFRVKQGTEDDGTVVLRNVSIYLPHGTVSRPKTLESSTCLLPAYQHVT